jgi:hypothetical protein
VAGLGSMDLEIKFSTEETIAICGCTPDSLKDLVRKWKDRKPIFKPTFPGAGPGTRTFYSFRDLMILKIIFLTRQVGVERGEIVERFVGMSKRAFSRLPSENPFSLHYLQPDSSSDRVGAPLKKYRDPLALRWFISIESGELAQRLVWLEKPDKKDSTYTREVMSYDWDPIPGKATESQLTKLSASEREEVEAGLAVDLRIDLNKIHWLIKAKLKEMGKL